MTAITEEFGKEAHVVMGAAIDEGLQGKVEICVIGTTDLGGRNFARRPVTPAKRPEKPAATATSQAADSNHTVKTTVMGDGSRAPVSAAHPAAEKPKQEEFGFGGGAPAENRGSFDKSDRNLFEGQDLDVPTYLRKGIKVAL